MLCETTYPFNLKDMDINDLKKRILAGGEIDREEAVWLSRSTPSEILYRSAGEIRNALAARKFDTCSIINARSGRCSENCKWCAQSVVFKTNIETYEWVDEARCLSAAALNVRYGVDKFSFVTSGRALSDENIDRICGYARKIRAEFPLNLCASMGLLNKQQLLRLRDAGISRYHCNIESSPDFFPTLCSSHTLDEKIATIRAAREIGMDVCSGGIIGMGEDMDDRIDMALMLRELGIESIPLNILNPIPGTALENASPLSDEEVLRTIAVFRFIHPKAFLRFAGGRTLIRHIEDQAIAAGMNAAIVGDLLTTPGPEIEQDTRRLGIMD